MYNIVEERIASYKNTEDMIFALVARYSFLRLKIIGESELGKKIYAVELGENKDKVLYMAAFHGQEWLTTLVLLKFIEDLSEAYRMRKHFCGVSVRKALTESGLIFVPMVNPDGVDLSLYGIDASGKNREKIKKISGGDFSWWNANANGVDINHNFDAGYCISKVLEEEAGILEPAPGKYGGQYPESEKESFAVAELCRTVNLKHALCLHSQGEEIFYEYGENTPEKSETMAKVLSLSSGYELVKQSGTASHAGCKDYIIDSLKKPAFTVEMGKGKNPLPLSDFRKIYEQTAEMLMLSAIL